MRKKIEVLSQKYSVSRTRTPLCQEGKLIKEVKKRIKKQGWDSESNRKVLTLLLESGSG